MIKISEQVLLDKARLIRDGQTNAVKGSQLVPAELVEEKAGQDKELDLMSRLLVREESGRAARALNQGGAVVKSVHSNSNNTVS